MFFHYKGHYLMIDANTLLLYTLAFSGLVGFIDHWLGKTINWLESKNKQKGA